MKKVRKGLTLALAMAMVLSITACSSGQTGSSSGSTGSGSGSTSGEQQSTPEGNIELRMMWWGPDTRHEATLKAIDLYKEVQPDITIVPEYLGWEGYWNKLVVLAASSSMPDILQMDAQYLDNYVSQNQMADISHVDLGDAVDPEVLEALKIDGKLYTIPLGRNAAGLAYNKTALEAAGVTLPKEGWTWDDYFAFIDEVHEKMGDGVYAVNDVSSSWEYYQFYQTSMGGGRMIEGNKLNINKDLWFDYMERMAKYREEGKVPTPEEVASFIENDAMADPLASGKCMVRHATVGSVGALLSLMPDTEIGIVNYPIGSTGESGGWAQSTIFFGVGANSQYVDEALEFEKWFITDPEAGEILMTTRGLPISDAVYESLQDKLQPTDVLGNDLYEVAMRNNPQPFYPSSTEFVDFVAQPSGTYRAVMENYMFGGITLEEAYDQLIAAGEEILKNNP